MNVKYRSSNRSVYSLTVHLVFVTKYRRKIINSEVLVRLEEIFKSVLEKWGSELIEFNGEADHVHLLISYPPHKLLSSLVANLKSTSSKTLWREYEDYLSKTYWKNRVFWTGSYFVASCGGVTIEQLKKYVENQNSPTEENYF